MLGYYGYHNLGDDLMAQGLLDYFSTKKDIFSVTIVTLEPYYYIAKDNIRSCIPPKNYIEWFKFIKQFDIIFWGGGTCLYSNPGLLWLFIISLFAYMMNKKLYYIGVGVEYPQNYLAKFAIHTILKMSTAICVRDIVSFRICEEMYKIPNKKICKIPDLAYLGIKNRFRHEISKKSDLSLISYSGHYEFIDDMIVEHLAIIFTEFLKAHNNVRVIFLPAHERDNIQHDRIFSLIPQKYKNRIIRISNIKFIEYEKILCKVDFHIGYRLHSLFLAEIHNIPYLAINYAQKVKSFVKSQNRQYVNINTDFNLAALKKIKNEWKVNNYDLDKLKEEIFKCLDRILKIG